jgi:hypothetical protein
VVCSLGQGAFTLCSQKATALFLTMQAPRCTRAGRVDHEGTDLVPFRCMSVTSREFHSRPGRMWGYLEMWNCYVSFNWILHGNEALGLFSLWVLMYNQVFQNLISTVTFSSFKTHVIECLRLEFYCELKQHPKKIWPHNFSQQPGVV